MLTKTRLIRLKKKSTFKLLIHWIQALKLPFTSHSNYRDRVQDSSLSQKVISEQAPSFSFYSKIAEMRISILYEIPLIIHQIFYFLFTSFLHEFARVWSCLCKLLHTINNKPTFLLNASVQNVWEIVFCKIWQWFCSCVPWMLPVKFCAIYNLLYYIIEFSGI